MIKYWDHNVLWEKNWLCILKFSFSWGWMSMQPAIFGEPVSAAITGTGSNGSTSVSAFGLSAGHPHQCQSHFVFGLHESSWTLNTSLKDIKGSCWRPEGHCLFSSLPDPYSQKWSWQSFVDMPWGHSLIVYSDKAGRPGGWCGQPLNRDLNLKLRENEDCPPEMTNTGNKNHLVPILESLLPVLFLSRYEVVFQQLWLTSIQVSM